MKRQVPASPLVAMRGWRNRPAGGARTVGTCARGVLVLLATVVAAACGSTTMTSISPSGSRCAVSVTPSGDVPAGGGVGTVSVSAEDECVWSVTSNAAWITRVRPQSGQGAGQVQFDVAPNNGPARSGTLTVDDEQVTITQRSGCHYGLNPSSVSAPIAGDSVTVTVSTTANCPWTASTNAPWIQLTGNASGTGGGTVRFSVQRNSSPARNGIVTIGDERVAVSQASGCNYTVQPASILTVSEAGPIQVSVSAGAGCTWSAQSDSSWIARTSPENGSGDGQAQFTVAKNSGPERTGAVTVAGKTVSVRQASGCTYMVSPTSMSFSVLGGPGTIAVTTTAGCTWTASANQAWIFIYETTADRVNFAIIPMVVPTPRSGTITIMTSTGSIPVRIDQGP